LKPSGIELRVPMSECKIKGGRQSARAGRRPMNFWRIDVLWKPVFFPSSQPRAQSGYSPPPCSPAWTFPSVPLGRPLSAPLCPCTASPSLVAERSVPLSRPPANSPNRGIHHLGPLPGPCFPRSGSPPLIGHEANLLFIHRYRPIRINLPRPFRPQDGTARL